jgi:BRCT domain type II-containing protein
MNVLLLVVLTFLTVVASTTTTDAFVTPTSSSSYSLPSLLLAESSSSSSSSAGATTTTTTTSDSDNIGYTVQVLNGGEDDTRVVDVATYRNGIVSPQMMVDRAQKKRNGMDNNKAALDGLKIGLLYVGPLVAVGTYFSSSGSDTVITDAIKNYGE